MIQGCLVLMARGPIWTQGTVSPRMIRAVGFRYGGERGEVEWWSLGKERFQLLP